MRSSSLPQHMATTFFVSAAWTTICERGQTPAHPFSMALSIPMEHEMLARSKTLCYDM